MAGLLSIAPRVRFSLGAYRIPPRDRPSHSIYFEKTGGDGKLLRLNADVKPLLGTMEKPEL
jgi:hypothetical protein